MKANSRTQNLNNLNPADLVVLNLRGTKYETQIQCLEKLPQFSKLSRKLCGNLEMPIIDLIKHQCIEMQQELYIDSNPLMFNHILDYLKYEELHFPENVCTDLIAKELDFWGFPDKVLASCCYERVLKEHDGKQETLKLTRLWKRMTSNDKKVFPCERDENGQIVGRIKWVQEKLWSLLEKPTSSKVARVWAICPILVIILSVIILVLETQPIMREPSFQAVISKTNITKGNGLIKYYMENSYPQSWIFSMDIIFTAILSMEYILRFIVSPAKRHFLTTPLNIADLLGLLPMWIHFAFQLFVYLTTYNNEWMQAIMDTLSFFKLCRTLRFGRVMMLNKQLRVVFLALAHSWQELVIMVSIIVVSATVFGSLIFYIELERDNYLTVFHGMWWSIVTMTTVGYGDYSPITEAGFLVGVVCSVSGIVIIALTTTIVVNHFLVTYSAVENYERALKSEIDIEGTENSQPEHGLNNTMNPLEEFRKEDPDVRNENSKFEKARQKGKIKQRKSIYAMGNNLKTRGSTNSIHGSKLEEGTPTSEIEIINMSNNLTGENSERSSNHQITKIDA